MGNAAAKLAPAGAAKITKLETRGVVRYVALPEPVIRYTARLEGEGGRSAPRSPRWQDSRQPGCQGTQAPAVPKNPRKEDGPIPEPAARAVKAMREVFPTMVFDLVEEVPYVDSTTETMTMVWYEVEFYLDGEKKEFNATPMES